MAHEYWFSSPKPVKTFLHCNDAFGCCGHRHKTAEAAERCLTKLLKRQSKDPKRHWQLFQVTGHQPYRKSVAAKASRPLDGD
jgi:hypothetical protein